MFEKLLRLFFATLVVAVPGALFGQNYVDVVYLKNGSIIRGMIIEQVPNQQIKVKTSDGSVFVYAMSDVEKMTKETSEQDNSARIRNTRSKHESEQYERTGYVNITEVGVGMGIGKATRTYSGSINTSSTYTPVNSSYLISISTVNGGWIAAGNLSAGIGVGLDVETTEHWGQLPVFADLRIVPASGKTSPMIILQPGYAFGIISTNSKYASYTPSGYVLRGGLGILGSTSKGSAICFSIEYDYRQLRYSWSLFGSTFDNTTVDTTYGNLRLNFGMAF